MSDALSMSVPERQALGQLAVQRVRAHYSWEPVVDSYEHLLIGLTERRSPKKIRSKMSEDSHP